MALDLKFGLSSSGFLAPTYEEVLDAVQTDLKRRAGTDIVFAPNSNYGILSMHEAYFYSLYFQQLQMVYFAAYVSTATGTGLDRLASNATITRKMATPADTVLHIVSTEAYLIESGTQFETMTGTVFDIEDNTITEQQADGTYAVDARAIADEPGADTNVPANSITVVTDPDTNIISVTNPDAAGGGIDDEQDDELRRRIISETIANPAGTINGIKTALLNVSGVRQVNDVQNQDDTTDKYGNPPYTSHIYVLGGSKDAILDALSQYEGYGPMFVGSETGQRADITGDLKTYSFDFATAVQIYVNIDIKTNGNWDADSGPGELQDLVTGFINELEMGADIVLTKLYPDIYSVDGIDQATITIGRDATSLSSSDIQLDKFEAPQCIATNVTVSEVS